MKILAYTDCHFSQYSSIVRKRGVHYSKRLENLINSLNWAEKLAVDNGCELVVCCGDFFDKPELNDEELTAIRDVNWNNLHHYFIVGNHESSVNGLRFNSTKVLERDTFTIVDKPCGIQQNDTEIDFIPYIVESDRQPLDTYLTGNWGSKRVVFSHNDVKGIRYGMFESKEGFSLDEIDMNCNLYINGHLHNGGFLNDRETILNLGNLTGQNFSEDAFNYSHYVCIVDTDTLELTFYENPYAFNFYKIELNTLNDFNILDNLKDNAVVTIKCKDELIQELKEKLNIVGSNYCDYKIIGVSSTELDNSESTIDLSNDDYLKQFKDYILQNVDNSDITKQELFYIVGSVS